GRSSSHSHTADELRPALMLESPNPPGLPNFQKHDRTNNRDNSGSNIHEIAIAVVGPGKLRQGKRNPYHQDGGKHLEGLTPAHHRTHQPKGHKHGGEG